MDNACRECAAGTPHCHGTLIRHSTQHLQCTEFDCAHPEVLLHSLTIDCDGLGCQCAHSDFEQSGFDQSVDERAAM